MRYKVLAGRTPRLEYCPEFICHSERPRYIDECDIHVWVHDMYIYKGGTGPICTTLSGLYMHDLCLALLEPTRLGWTFEPSADGHRYSLHQNRDGTVSSFSGKICGMQGIEIDLWI